MRTQQNEGEEGKVFIGLIACTIVVFTLTVHAVTCWNAKTGVTRTNVPAAIGQAPVNPTTGVNNAGF